MPADLPNDDFSRLERYFDRAISLPPEERGTFATEACGDDLDLLANLRSLLVAYDKEQQASQMHEQRSHDQAPLHLRLGPYQIESLLGRGGMGAVYLAHRADGQYEKKVAVKVVDLPLATEVFFERFRQERQILASLDHPNIARLLDGGVSEHGVLFLAMEYIEGVRIDDYCRSRNLTVEEKLRLFIAVCGAVQFAHQNLVVHRDLKPDNVLVSADGMPHLLDFGTAKLMSHESATEMRGLTREGFLSFTPEYASPEQVLGRPVATTSDTYSLGVLLYQMLTGHLPYELSEFTAEEMIRIICDRPVARPTSTDKTFPNADLEAILAKALRKEPEDRYQTADQFSADVQSYLDHNPVLARKGNLRYRTLKFARRNRLAISFAAVLLLSVIAGVVGVLWQAHAARVAEKASEQSAEDLSKLSDTLLSELDDAIKQLPGSTGAQQLLVSRVSEHLDRMSQNPHSDVVTQISLVNAYVRLGNLQANPYEQNLGDTPGALHSLDKAMALATKVVAAQRRNPDALLALARAQDARGEILSYADNNAEAVAGLEASTKTYDQLLATPSISPALLFEAGSVIDTLGDVMGQDTGFADAAAALQDYRRAIEYDNRALVMQPDFMRSRRGLVVMQMKVGNVELDTDPAGALDEFKAAFTRLNGLPQVEQERLDQRRIRGLLLRKQALALSELGRYSEADPLFAESTAIYQGIAAADPKDARALRDLDRLLTNETFRYKLAADPQLSPSGSSPVAALAGARKLELEHAEVLKKLIVMTPNDAAVKQSLAAITVRTDAMGATAQNTGQNIQRDREALAQLRSAASDSKASLLLLDLAFHAWTEAKPASLRDAAFAVQCAERGVAATHGRDPSWLLSLAQANTAAGKTQQAQDAAREGLKLLPNKPEDRNFYLARLLQIEAQ